MRRLGRQPPSAIADEGYAVAVARHDGEGRTPNAGRAELSHPQGPDRGWLLSQRAGIRRPGVLLHGDAFLVHVDPSDLRDPPSDLVVHVGAATRAIDEILLIDEPTAQDRSSAMIRLRHPLAGTPAVVIDRAAVIRSWDEREPLWTTLHRLGAVPAAEPAPVGTVPGTLDRPAAIAVKSVTAGPADWCTIFWWLC